MPWEADQFVKKALLGNLQRTADFAQATDAIQNPKEPSKFGKYVKGVPDPLLEKDPNSADLLFRLGETYGRKGDINLAAETFRKDVQAAPNNTLPLLKLGLILESTGPPEQAKAIYEQILKIDPNQAIALNNLAFRKAEEGSDLDGALAQLAEQGIEPEKPPYSVRDGGSRLCFVRDPDGYRIELLERG